ncbi:hypothetical protein LOK49_LG12G00781 [Camellia lanceoleosa]|uniref:Uncharacterized protein n=1 Tax=Camellia lanceoleosa TaxID=1840588 RepID=A0ACC0FTR4_9ERIC|nr:hypothetical protein LOK49_LG12G00781 [Camellia lanceoleosa]
MVCENLFSVGSSTGHEGKTPPTYCLSPILLQAGAVCYYKTFFMIVIGFELLCLIGGFLSHELLDHNHIKLGYRITLAIILY